MDDQNRTIYCGNLSEKVTEDMLYELFLQAGPLEKVTIPKDKDGRQKNFGFINFKHEVSVKYAVALMNGISLYGRPLRLDARSSSAEDNQYLKQLQQYMYNAQMVFQQNSPRYQQNDRYPSDNQYPDSRRTQSRSTNQVNTSPGVYMSYPAVNYFPMVPQVILPQSVHMYPYSPSPTRYNDTRNSRSNYRY